MTEVRVTEGVVTQLGVAVRDDRGGESQLRVTEVGVTEVGVTKGVVTQLGVAKCGTDSVRGDRGRE